MAQAQMPEEAGKIQAVWSQWSHVPSEAEMKRAALLAWEDHLTSVENMTIENISITDIPRDHMEKLASIVTGIVKIDNMTHADQLGGILASVKCTDLWLWRMELSEAETRALVTAMRDRVQEVELRSRATLDIEELTQYDGQGRCSKLGVWRGRERYGARLREWTADKGWTVTDDDEYELVMER